MYFFFYRNRGDVFKAPHLKLLLMLLNGHGYDHSILPHWQTGLTLFSFPLSTTWHWLFEKVHALRIISGLYTMELICSLGHQYTFIFLQYIFRAFTQKALLHSKGITGYWSLCCTSFPKFSSAAWPLSMVLLNTLPWFLGCDRGTRFKSSFSKVLSRQTSQVWADVSVSELQQTYVLHIVVETTGMEEIVLQRGPVPVTLYASKHSFTVLFIFFWPCATKQKWGQRRIFDLARAENWGCFLRVQRNLSSWQTGR